jgi:hypothetical protein
MAGRLVLLTTDIRPIGKRNVIAKAGVRSSLGTIC